MKAKARRHLQLLSALIFLYSNVECNDNVAFLDINTCFFIDYWLRGFTFIDKPFFGIFSHIVFSRVK